MCPAPIASGGRGRHARLRPWAGPRVGALPQLPYTHTGHSVHSPSHPLVSSQCPSGCQVRRRVRARNRHPRRRAEAGCGGVVDEREDACGVALPMHMHAPTCHPPDVGVCHDGACRAATMQSLVCVWMYTDCMACTRTVLFGLFLPSMPRTNAKQAHAPLTSRHHIPNQASARLFHHQPSST